MTPKQIINTIQSVCDTLFTLGLVSYYNTACEQMSENEVRVSFPVRGATSAHVHPFGSLEQYCEWITNGEYTCLLFDHSIIRACYTVAANRVVAHSLLFWPCPLEPHVPLQSLEDVREAIALCHDSAKEASSVCGLSLRSPMRFDYDPDAASDDHPEVHLHTQFDDVRLHVQEPMCFAAFVKLILRTFYASRWFAEPGLALLHEQAIEPFHGDIAAGRYCLQVNWT